MKRNLRVSIATMAVALAVVLAPFASKLVAQATVTSTTLSAAVSATATRIAVASATGFSAGRIVVVDKEAMGVSTVSGTNITVSRGTQGTAAAAHASGTVAYVGPPNYFSQSDPAGPCVATAEVALPRIVLGSGNIYDCKSSEWVVYRRAGIRAVSSGRNDGGTTYTAAGALTIQPGVSFIGSGGALAMTLANPTKEQNGMIMMIIASTAQAHTVTYTAGFGGGTTARDVGTFGGAINDALIIVAFNEVWWVISTRNVTLA